MGPVSHVRRPVRGTRDRGPVSHVLLEGHGTVGPVSHVRRPVRGTRDRGPCVSRQTSC